MAGYNPSDISFAITTEVTPGTTPATGVYKKLDHVPGTAPSYTSDFIESPVLSANRASAGNRKTNFRVENGLKSHLCRDDAIELLMQSAFSGVWTEAGAVGEGGDTLKASDVDTSLTIEKKVAGSPTLYSRYNGCQVSKMALSVEASGNAEVSFDVMGMGRTTATSASALTYENASSNLKLTGRDVSSVSIAGLTGIQFRSLELSVEHSREARDAFGSASAVGIGTSGNRKVMLKLSFYRTDFTPEAVLVGDAPVAVSFTIGSGVDGFTFTLPAATAAVPADAEDGSKYMVEVEFTARRDETAGTDLMVTRL